MLNLILIVCSKTLTPFDEFYNTIRASHKRATTSADTGFTGKANIAVGNPVQELQRIGAPGGLGLFRFLQDPQEDGPEYEL